MILGHPGLRKLARMKLRGSVRRQLRRMKSLSGLFFMVLGLALMGVWIASLLASPNIGSRGPSWEGELLRSTTQFGILFFGAITLAGALSVRGLYLPKQEIERMFASPLSRSDLVRYRMQVDLARTLVGGLVLGVLVYRRMPVGVFGFLGAFLAVMTLTVVRQAASLLIGDANGRLGRFFRRRKLIVTRVAVGVLAWFAVMVLIFGQGFFDGIGGIGSERSLESYAGAVLLHPVAQWLLLPLRPWAEAMVATTLSSFVLWGGISSALFFAMYEFTARLPIDYREMSLETADEVAKRLTSLRRGGPFGSGKVSEAAAARRVPWVLGRGPFGAVVWIKTAAILRKARGTLLLSIVVVLLVTTFISVMSEGVQSDHPELGRIFVPLLIALLGLVYLAGGLRFDFRSELDRMEHIKSWPLSPSRLFLACLLPETLLIWALLSVALIVRALLLDAMHPAVWGTIAGLPFATLGWLAVDNAVFLLSPVRFVPGQEGALHHTGRAMALLFLRMLVFALASVLVAAAVIGTTYVGRARFDLQDAELAVLAGATGLVVLVLIDTVLVKIGGSMLRRFDVARDRA